MIFNYLSNGLQALGVEKAYEFIDIAVKLNPNSKIVSIGSGNGYFESLVEQKFKIEIICVEPRPNKFNPIPKMNKQPDYQYTVDLVMKRTINDCILLLNWCDPGYSEYDYEAIILLQPKIIIWIGETNMGSAGGYRFHDWLKHNDTYKTINFYHRRNDFDPVNQKINGILIYSIIILEKK